MHIGQNKDKMLFVLYSSKTHGQESRPQKVKITANHIYCKKEKQKRFFCPFKKSREYLALRGNYRSETDPFFVHKDNSPVTPAQVRIILKRALKSINLNPELYGFHSLRIGRAGYMISFNYKISDVKLAGRW